MIKSVHVENFKSLVDFSAELTELTVFIGNNSSGKSTVLQAIQFICESIRSDYDVILQKRNWSVENIRSKFSESKKIVFGITFELMDEKGQIYTFKWDTEIMAFTSKNEMYLDSESVKVDDDTLLEYKHGKKYLLALNGAEADEEGSLYNVLKFHSSVMKNIRKSKDLDPRLVLLMNHIDKVMSFELLTPEKMRLSSRGTTDVIEASGKNLPSFIKRMSGSQKESFMKKIGWLLDGSVVDVDTETKGQPGWTQIKVLEQYSDKNVSITSKEMSDGMLRLVAFVAIGEMQADNATYLLDEIENGINLLYVERLTKLFSDMAKEKKTQIILTTHSTLFMDYFAADSIIKLERNKYGETIAEKIFEDEELKQQLEYMYPGEIILNMSSEINE